jgi:carbon-monoxide dehydrogenase medium subunit
MKRFLARDLIDLERSRIPLGSRQAVRVTIGAMTRHAEVANSPEVESDPCAAALAGMIGDEGARDGNGSAGLRAIRWADIPRRARAGATITTNKRKIAADDFFKGLYETALQAGEVITSVSFPVPRRAGYAKFKNQASRFAIVGVFVADSASGTRVAVTGAGPSVFRQKDMEKALSAKFDPSSVASVKQKADGLNTDLHASAEYRAHLFP